MTMTYPFTEEQMEAAADEWGCNCGPSALAFALQKPLGDVRYAIPGFDTKGYTSPTMMKAALANLRQPYTCAVIPLGGTNNLHRFWQERPSLMRVQWTGPWTKPGVNPKWAYRMTHWITIWKERVAHLVFDCNGGVRDLASWCDEIVPELTGLYPRADGGWYPTHIWTLGEAGATNNNRI